VNNDTQEYSIAIHEAGHAVMAALLGKIINYVTIVPKGDAQGECNSEFSNQDLNTKVDITCLVLLAGITAQRILLGIEPDKCCRNGQVDSLAMGALVSNMFTDEKEAMRYSEYMIKLALNTFNNPIVQQQVKAVANALIEHKTLTGSQVISMLEEIKVGQ